MDDTYISSTLIASVAGAILSVIMTYVPGVSTAYDKLSPTAKQAVMGGMLVLAAAGVIAWSCHGDFNTCVDGIDWRAYGMALFGALTANQSTHRITRKLPDVPPGTQV